MGSLEFVRERTSFISVGPITHQACLRKRKPQCWRCSLPMTNPREGEIRSMLARQVVKPSSEKCPPEVWNLANDFGLKVGSCSCTRKYKHYQLSCPGWKSQFPQSPKESSFALHHQFSSLDFSWWDSGEAGVVAERAGEVDRGQV